ncbi:hypothetical protein VMCG_08106 [Cytospora schulzeri]|uniref:Major facilitator superfamily (MFS) profile domain-containing protein n=1 Tax=Cytospora schulzeri TaxID=448051 RepID=A0A423VRT3_9PEZI|nr:hypothetical protein VMCG_08106 [Valsa malicola]
MKTQNEEITAVSASDIPSPPSSTDERAPVETKTLLQKFKSIVWDTLDRSPEERRFLAKIDFFILTWAGFTYFSKNLNTNNVSNAYVSGMKEELNVVGNEYQTFTTMWTIGYVISQIPSQIICTRVRLSLWCPSWELFWVVVTFASSAVKTPQQLWAWQKGHSILQSTRSLAGGYYALPDLPSTTRVRWLKPEEKALALDRMKRAGKQLEEPFTMQGMKRVLKKWHFWVYTTYYTENIGTYMNLWLKSLDRYTVAEINTYPTVVNAITIVTTLCYGWTSDALQVRAPIVYFSLFVCFFAAMNLTVWDGVPFGLKWASYYLTGFAPGSGPVFLTMVNEQCAGDSLERKFILGTTNAVAYAFNAWIPLLTYNTTYAPRFLVGNSTTVGLIVCAAMTLTLAVFLQRRDADSESRLFHREPEEGYGEKGYDGQNGQREERVVDQVGVASAL